MTNNLMKAPLGRRLSGKKLKSYRSVDNIELANLGNSENQNPNRYSGREVADNDMAGMVTKFLVNRRRGSGFSPLQPSEAGQGFVVDFGDEHRAEILKSPAESSLNLICEEQDDNSEDGEVKVTGHLQYLTDRMVAS